MMAVLPRFMAVYFTEVLRCCTRLTNALSDFHWLRGGSLAEALSHEWHASRRNLLFKSGIFESLIRKQERGLMLYHTTSGMLLDRELDFDVEDEKRVHTQRGS